MIFVIFFVCACTFLKISLMPIIVFLCIGQFIIISTFASHARFTVVAEEVRVLAERSKRATAQIRSILGEIDKATRDAERSAEHGIQAVSEGRRRAESAAATIEELAAANEEAERTTREIADAAPEQQRVAERFVEATGEVSSQGKAVQASAHDSSRAAAELDALAERLRNLAKTLTEI